jgi:hypothetical protein
VVLRATSVMILSCSSEGAFWAMSHSRMGALVPGFAVVADRVDASCEPGKVL